MTPLKHISRVLSLERIKIGQNIPHKSFYMAENDVTVVKREIKRSV